MLFSACLPVFPADSGLDVAAAQDFELFRGKTVALLANRTAVAKDGRDIVSLFSAAKGVKLAAVFSPEHGFSGRADHGETVLNSSVSACGVPIYSLYGAVKRPTWEMLKGVDALVFDMADVGARFYTYLTSMAYALEEADKYGIEFYVLDRPNLAGGTIVEGPVLDDSVRAFTAYLAVPLRHGFTPGEAALFHADRLGLKAKPHVVKMKGWRRDMPYEETGLPWVNPSPNIRSADAADIYSGIACFEATNVSVGRGTAEPFLWIGAPWLEPEKTLAHMSSVPGVEISSATRTPEKDVLAGQKCPGLAFRVTDRAKLRAVELFVRLACALRDTGAEAFSIRWEDMKRMTGNGIFEELYKTGAPPEQILAAFEENSGPFREKRKSFLLY